jgi:hypothetical protein
MKESDIDDDAIHELAKVFARKFHVIGEGQAPFKDLEHFHKTGVELAISLFYARQQLAPVWIILDPTSTSTVIESTFENSVEKEMVIKTMSGLMKEKKAVSYSFISEAWMINLPETANAKDYPDGLEKVPGRKEVVIISSENDKDQWFSTEFVIERKGWKVSLTERRDTDFRKEGANGGRLVGLLKKGV